MRKMMLLSVLALLCFAYAVALAPPTFAAAANSEFTVTITARAFNYPYYSDTTIGVRTTATSGFDFAWDYACPPPPPVGIWSYVYCADGPVTWFKYCMKNFVGPSDTATWTIKIMAADLYPQFSFPGKWGQEVIMYLTWQGQFPAGKRALLLNANGQVLANMKWMPFYIFTVATGATATFKISVT